MKVFVIQPNMSATSEVWLSRMNLMLEHHICGIAAFINEIYLHVDYPIFNLFGRRPNFWERQLIRTRLKQYNADNVMRKELNDILKRTAPDLVLIHYATTAHFLLDVLDNLNIPLFIYVHGFDIIWDYRNDNGAKIHTAAYIKDLLDFSKKKNVQFIVSSSSSLNSLASINIPGNKVKFKTFGVSLPDIERDYSKSSLQILYLGRFVDFKGPDIVLKAFLKACKMGFNGNLVMAGDGPLHMMCQIIAKRSIYADRITFTGAVSKEEATKLFFDSDIYSMHNCHGIITKGFETFGVTIIEAMSFGLPVVTAPVGGPREIIENNVDGLLVEPGNVAEHAAAFMLLFKDKLLRKRLGMEGRSKVKIKYNSEIEKRELFKILGISGPSV